MHTVVHTEKVCTSLYREKVEYTDLVGFVPIFVCKSCFEIFDIKKKKHDSNFKGTHQV